MKKVEVTITIDTTPERVVQAFTDSSMLRDWWSVERALIGEQQGGPYTLAWNITAQGFGFVSSGIIGDYQPGSMLRIDQLVYLNPGQPILGPMTLTIKARAQNGKAELYLCQDGYQSGPGWDWYYEAVKQAWPVVANTLKEYLEKNKHDPQIGS